ncbi:RNA polymerase sigma factor [Dethiothermospora halolimnae]|uniref:RNA polymerase sigma factor n=1 Tax=Dethiothermospora halolimnae TaxID=3114390 RepID=UPI003CCBF717
MEEKILEESFSDGGEYELECTIELYGHSLLRYCHNILCDYHKAQDVVQVTFIKAYNKRKSFKKGYSLSAWLYSIAYNTCMDVLRKNRRRKILFFIPEVRINTVDSSTDFMSEGLKKALLKLTGAERALIFSRIMDEKSYKELEIIYQVSAATIPSFNKVISIVSPEIAYMLQPIGKSSEDNGIKIEVVAAYNDDEMAVLYLTMQDLIGDRIGESIDLYNYSLSKGSMFNAQVIDYDKASKTATLRIQVNGGERMDGKRLYLSVSSFLGHFQEFNEVVTGITLSDIKKVNSETIPLDTEYVSGVSGDLFFTEWEERGVIQVLKGDQKKILPGLSHEK